jgi:chemotaxis protein histidine kinase CheA
MSKQVQLVGKSDTGKLSKEQIKFNNYLTRIKSLKAEIEVFKADNTWLIKIGTERVLPIDRLDVIAHKDFILAMDGHRELDKLSFSQRVKFNDMMLQEIRDILNYEKFDDLKAIFDKYSGKDYDEHIAEAEAIAKKQAIDKVNQMYDMDLDADEEMEEIREKVANKKAEAEAAREAATAERRSKKKLSDKQQERADKQAAAEADMNKTTKQIYVDLVKNFHPDQEPDEVRRQWKTEIMKQVNVAYQENDFLKLMELQISLLEERENRLQGLGDEQLKYFNKSLRQQLEELEREADSVNPQFNGNPFARFYSRNRAISELQMEKHIKAMKQQTKSRRHNIEFIRSLFGLKEYLKQF